MWRLQSAFNTLTAALPVQLGLYAVCALFAAIATLTAIERCALAMQYEADRLLAPGEHDDAASRRVTRDELADGARPKQALYDKRGQRMLPPETQPISDKAVASADPASQKPRKVSTASVEQSALSGDPRQNWYRGYGGTYTTACVRLCDGSIRTVSYSTTFESFDRDAETCRSSCGSPTRLYVYPNPGGTVDEMQDARGQPYSRLKTAYLFRTTYVANCTCRAAPWELAAVERHHVYALQEKAQKGDAKARAELRSLGPRVAALTRPNGEEQRGEVASFGTAALHFNSRVVVRPDPITRPYTYLSAQSVASGWFGGSGGGLMSLGAGSSSRQNGYRPNGSSSRESGWAGKMFEAR